ncbi:probable galactose-1-phosphate uridylyltransferase [Cephalotrichum gorgonifer]|uniref:Galactose-1-phosphate uridylyltransferase n=1 Tax=Cephalotrichum gorgonifer TaxID=2041049 RepID=A0AAE8MTD6_9PEZI|nr:probable galactose-1-phosphate uridylyltransferase [Cephalotrichum gorgonifer]
MGDSVLNDISHRRYNPLNDTWLLVSPHRTKRPWQGQQEGAAKIDLPEYDPKCYLCPGNQRAQGDSNPQYTETFVFVNDYSAVKESQAEYTPEAPKDDQDLSATLLRAQPTTGACYVLTFAAKHNVTLADMTAAEILPVIETWTRIYAEHLSPASPLAGVYSLDDSAVPSYSKVSRPAKQLRYMQIFENKGATMGCSNPHPHCQVWTTSTMPEEPGTELRMMGKYRDEHSGRHLLGDYVRLEMEKKERIVWQNEGFLVVCPWWAIWPFEVLVLPKRHVRALVDFTAEERMWFAEAVQEVTRRYDNLFQCSFPYSSGIHQAPIDGTPEEVENSYLHMHFYPPLLRSATVKKFLVGYELMAEAQRDITPEQAAARLRDCGGELYRKSL